MSFFSLKTQLDSLYHLLKHLYTKFESYKYIHYSIETLQYLNQDPKKFSFHPHSQDIFLEDTSKHLYYWLEKTREDIINSLEEAEKTSLIIFSYLKMNFTNQLPHQN